MVPSAFRTYPIRHLYGRKPKTKDKKKRTEAVGIPREWKGSVAKTYSFYLKLTSFDIANN